MQKYKGFILVIVLLFFQVSMMLILYLWNAAGVENKLSRMYFHKMDLESNSTYVLKQIKSYIQKASPLFIEENIGSTDLSAKPLSWWKNQNSGVFRSNQYYYVVELLSGVPCASLKGSVEECFSLYRVSLLVLGKYFSEKIFLQSVVKKTG